MTVAVSPLHKTRRLAQPPIPANNPRLAAASEQIAQASTLLAGLRGLFDVLSARPSLTYSADTIEYLLERWESIDVHLARAILGYARATNVDATEIDNLRQVLDLPAEDEP